MAHPNPPAEALGRRRRRLTAVIIESLPLYAKALASVLTGQLGLRVVGRAGTLAEGLGCLRAHSPDLVVIDRDAPDGNALGVLPFLPRLAPGCRAIVTGSRFDPRERDLASRFGAAACLAKTADVREVERTLRSLDPDREPNGAHAARAISAGARRTLRYATDRGMLHALTRRELQVLRYLVRGLTAREVSQELALSTKTVDSHKTRLMAKLDIHDRAALVRYAIRTGVISARGD